MTVDFIQPGMILIAAGFLILIAPRILTKMLMTAGPVLTISAVIITGGQGITMIFGLIFSVISLMSAIYNLHAKDRFETGVEAIYAGSGISVVFSAHWIGMLIFWELMAAASWLIVICGRTSASRKAGFRYLMIHMLGGSLLLCGIVIKIFSGETMIENLTGNLDLSAWLILAGVAVNAAIPPLNAWIADAYPESTAGGTVYMASFTTKVGVFCLIKIFSGMELLLYFGVFMAVWGAAMALIENDFRRLLSYHIISQVGYMVASLSMGTEAGIDGASAHAFNHILYKGTLMMCAGSVIAATGIRKINKLGNLRKKMPVTSACFAIASMAIAGFPLINGFVSKAVIMEAASESGLVLTELLLTVASVGTLLSVTLKVNYFVFFGRSENTPRVNPAAVTLNMKAAMIAGSAACVITGIFPELVYGLTPFGTDGHPFTAEHVIHYILLFAGGTAAFIIYAGHMKPKDRITLDTDWFYRAPLKKGLYALSSSIDGLRVEAGDGLGRFFALANRYMHQPGLLLRSKPHVKRDCIENDDVLQKPAGWLVALNFILFAALVLTVFIITA